MLSEKNAPRLLGFAFLFVALASLFSSFPIDSFGISLIGLPENITETMLMIAEKPTTFQSGIAGYLIESCFIVLLSLLLYTVLKKENRILATWGFGLWLLEAAFVAVRQMILFALLRVSQLYSVTPSLNLMDLGTVFYQLYQSVFNVQMIFYSFGGLIFYGLFYKARNIPRWLSLWGVLAASMSLLGELFVVLDYGVFLYTFLPILPFELAIGLWLMLKGTRNDNAPEMEEKQ